MTPAATRLIYGTAAALLVCVSGYGQEHDRRRALEAGFDAVLVKPADPDVLVGLLARTRRGHRQFKRLGTTWRPRWQSKQIR